MKLKKIGQLMQLVFIAFLLLLNVAFAEENDDIEAGSATFECRFATELSPPLLACQYTIEDLRPASIMYYRLLKSGYKPTTAVDVEEDGRDNIRMYWVYRNVSFDKNSANNIQLGLFSELQVFIERGEPCLLMTRPTGKYTFDAYIIPWGR